MKLEEHKDGNLLLISSETGSLYDDIPYGIIKAAINSLTGALSRRVVTIQNWRIDYHVSFPYLRAKLKT